MATIISTTRLPADGTPAYTVFGNDLSEAVPNTTSGIVVLGTDAGTNQQVVATVITLPDGVTKGVVLWDDGAGTMTEVPFDTTIGSGGGGTREIIIEA